jgi:hypothetical protein
MPAIVRRSPAEHSGYARRDQVVDLLRRVAHRQQRRPGVRAEDRPARRGSSPRPPTTTPLLVELVEQSDRQ